MAGHHEPQPDAQAQDLHHAGGGVMRDDRVFPETRLLGAVIVPFLVVAFALLYFFPDDTRHVAFWIWVGLYVTTPVLVPLAWWRNRATDPGRGTRR
jgi:hypothetical protein